MYRSDTTLSLVYFWMEYLHCMFVQHVLLVIDLHTMSPSGRITINCKL